MFSVWLCCSLGEWNFVHFGNISIPIKLEKREKLPSIISSCQEVLCRTVKQEKETHLRTKKEGGGDRKSNKIKTIRTNANV